MSDKSTAPEADQPTPGASAEEKPNDFPKLPEWAQSEMQALRREAAAHREKKLEAERAAKAAEDARLTEQQKWQELADKRGKELEGLKPIQERLTAYETAFKTALHKRLEAIPDQFKTLVPEFDDPVKTWGWLDANQHLFTARKAPGLDGGAQDQSGKQAPQLTAQEVLAAKAMGLTLEVYAKRKAEAAAQRDQST